MASPEFEALKARLNYLKSTLPKSTVLNQKQTDHVKAVVLHQHAACEQFIEDRSSQVADAALALYNNSGTMGRTAKHLCVFPLIADIKQPPDVKKIAAVFGSVKFGIFIDPSYLTSNPLQIKQLLNIGYQAYKRTWDSNNGITQKYQLKMLAALGVDIGEFDPGFVSSVNTLAKVRGEAAHTNLVVATNVADPTAVRTWTPQLISGFEALDAELTDLPNKLQ